MRQPTRHHPASVPADEAVAARVQPKTPDDAVDSRATRKQMAYVGAVYTIARHVRTADQVVDELQRHQCAQGRPRPCHKRVWAEMTTVVEGEECNGRVTLFDHLAEERRQRDGKREKPTICLLDGERALWEVRKEFFPDAVGILDLFHVMERLWDAAHCFHPVKSAAADAFVTERLRMLLEGKVGYVIGGLRQMATKQGLKGTKFRELQKVLTYFRNNRKHMKYDEYLAAGYPIGSGVAEGACRHLVKDRMEQTGMRWKLEGAQSLLHLRAAYLNGDWKAFVDYRIHKEQKQLYGERAQEPTYTTAV